MIRSYRRELQRLRSAVFQVLLIVVGVLLALWANEWNSARLERKEAQRTLASLRVDLVRDSVRLEADIRSAQAGAQTAALLVRILEHGTTVAEPVINLIDIDRLGRFTPTPFTNRTYRELVEGEGIRRLQNERVRDALHEYHDAVNRQERLNELYRQRLWEGFQPYVIGAFPLALQRQIIRQETLEISSVDYEQVVSYFRSTEGGVLQVRSAYRTYALIESQYTRLLQGTAALLVLVDSAAAVSGRRRN
jgi:hypothetical protein